MFVIPPSHTLRAYFNLIYSSSNYSLLLRLFISFLNTVKHERLPSRAPTHNIGNLELSSLTYKKLQDGKLLNPIYFST